MAEEGDDKERKTEQPTSKRLSEAREKGQLPISREIGLLTMFIGCIIALVFFIPTLGMNMARSLRIFFEMPHQFDIGGVGLQRLVSEVMTDIGISVTLVFGVMIAAAFIGIMSQTGGHMSAHPLKPDISKLNPIKGFKNMFSLNTKVEFLKGVVKMSAVGYAAYLLLRPLYDQMELFVGRDIVTMMDVITRESMHLLLILVAVMAVVGFIDFIYQRYTYLKNLRMTREEVKDEHKQVEGDPIVKSRIRALRMEKARKRMMAAVPTADVVITNPTHYAVALKYEAGKMNAPMVVAKGLDKLAERIKALANDNNIPIIENPPLARELYKLVDVDQEIPTQHYRAVAELISYVYKLKGKKS